MTVAAQDLVCARLPQGCRCRAFTLVETVTAMAISSVLFLALGSTVVVASRAIPTGTEPVVKEGEISRGLALMASDVEVATAVSRTDGLTLTVPDRDGDSVSDTIVYSWAVGDQYMTRTWNGSTAETLFGPLSSGMVIFTTSDGRADRMLMVIQIADHTPSSRILNVEFLNRPAAP